MTEWRDDVRKIMMKAGLQSLPKTFLFVDTQVQVYSQGTGSISMVDSISKGVRNISKLSKSPEED